MKNRIVDLFSVSYFKRLALSTVVLYFLVSIVLLGFLITETDLPDSEREGIILYTFLQKNFVRHHQFTKIE